MTRIQANLVLLATGALWGMGFVAQFTAMEAIGPMLFIGLRSLLATLAILPFAIRESAQSQDRLSRGDWLIFIVIGLLLFTGSVAQQFGLLTTTVTNSGFLTGLYVVMTPFLGVLLFRNWPHVAVWPAAFSALAGIWLLSGGSLGRLTAGDWLTILCAFFWSLQIILIARGASRTGRPVTLAVTQFVICAILGLTAAAFTETIDWAAVRDAAPELLYSGIFSSGVAFTLQAVGQRYTTASQAAIFLSSEAVFAALFGALLLGERLPPIALVGCALIFIAILAVETVPAWKERRVTP
jgi:drug/metabolite transporter (DMT)-like permease